MARIRTIKPELASDVGLARLSRDSRYTLVLLISQADDQGLLLGNPRQLLGSLFPHDDDVTPAILHGWLDELESAEMITWRARKDGAPVVQIVNWQRHQKVDHPHKPVLEASLLDADSEESREALAKLSRHPRESLATPSRTDLTTVLPHNPTTTQPSGRSRKKPRDPAGGHETWMTPFAAVWDQHMTPGAFPFGPGAKPLKKLLDLGNSPEFIAECLGHYLSRRGVPFPRRSTDRDDWRPAKFKADIAIFADDLPSFNGRAILEDSAA